MEDADESNGGTASQQRRQALVEFELKRDPKATDREIAKRAGCAVASVVQIRDELSA